MIEINEKLAMCYRKKFITTEMLNADLKEIKRLNVLFAKLERSDKEVYVHEIVNMMKVFYNTFRMEKLIIVLYECVDFQYHATLDYIIREISESQKKWDTR